MSIAISPSSDQREVDDETQDRRVRFPGRGHYGREDQLTISSTPSPPEQDTAKSMPLSMRGNSPGNCRARRDPSGQPAAPVGLDDEFSPPQLGQRWPSSAAQDLAPGQEVTDHRPGSGRRASSAWHLRTATSSPAHRLPPGEWSRTPGSRTYPHAAMDHRCCASGSPPLMPVQPCGPTLNRAVPRGVGATGARVNVMVAIRNVGRGRGKSPTEQDEAQLRAARDVRRLREFSTFDKFSDHELQRLVRTARQRVAVDAVAADS